MGVSLARGKGGDRGRWSTALTTKVTHHTCSRRKVEGQEEKKKRAAEMDTSLNQTQMSDLLQDTQASLAASFARIEAYRLQNKQLRDEVAHLRAQVHGGGEAEGSTGPSIAKESLKFPPQQTQFPQQRSIGSHPVTIIEGASKVSENAMQQRKRSADHPRRFHRCLAT